MTCAASCRPASASPLSQTSDKAIGIPGERLLAMRAAAEIHGPPGVFQALRDRQRLLAEAARANDNVANLGDVYFGSERKSSAHPVQQK